MIIFFTITAALILDRLFGEPRRLHPLVGFGIIVNHVEKALNKHHHQKLKGLFSLILLITPIVIVTYYASDFGGGYFDLLVLTLCLGWQSLREHGLAVYEALKMKDHELAKKKVSFIVSRDVKHMNQNDMSKACIESVLENGADAMFSAIFWFLIAGAPGVVAYRLVNTLDAMWGYKNSRFYYFGWGAARLDDVMNFVPARLTAFSYFLASRNPLALYCWRTQGRNWKSPNAGPVMAAGAGSLNIQLGGSAIYNGVEQYRPALGAGNLATPDDIGAALKLIAHSLFIWLAIIFLVSLIVHYAVL